MTACRATYFIALVVQWEMSEGLGEMVAFIYFRALASLPTGAQILQNPIWRCLFFSFARSL